MSPRETPTGVPRMGIEVIRSRMSGFRPADGTYRTYCSLVELLDEVDALRERLRYEPQAFCLLGRALREAQCEALLHGHSVFLRFDGVPLTVDPDSDIEAMEAGYDEQLTAWHKAKRAAAAPDDGDGS